MSDCLSGGLAGCTGCVGSKFYGIGKQLGMIDDERWGMGEWVFSFFTERLEDRCGV